MTLRPGPARKYDLLGDDMLPVLGRLAHRIRTLRDIHKHRVRAGDLGRYVEGEHNLSHENAAWIAGEDMAVQRSRVLDHALARGRAVLSGHAVLGGSAVLDRQARASGHAVVRGRAHLTDLSSAEDTVHVAGDATIAGAVALTRRGAYGRSADGPWRLATANPDEPGYLDRLREAVEIDPAFDRVLAALGLPDALSRRAAVVELLDGPSDGRDAVVRIARAVRGTFHPNTYMSRVDADRLSVVHVAEAHQSPPTLSALRAS